MKRIILAALALGATTTVAGAQATPVGEGLQPGQRAIVYDETLSDKFEIKREIVDQVQGIWGETAAYATGNEIPEGLTGDIAAGQPLPEAAPVEAVPAALDDLPKLEDDSRWVKIGKHLVELKPDNTVAMVVYDVLP